jgi:hypothetical protein
MGKRLAADLQALRSDAVRTMIAASQPAGAVVTTSDGKHRLNASENREMTVYQSGVFDLANKLLLAYCDDETEVKA